MREMRAQSEQGGRMTVITGWRRVGETRVVRERKTTTSSTRSPLFVKPGSRFQKYAMDDNFLNFWFHLTFKR